MVICLLVNDSWLCACCWSTSSGYAPPQGGHTQVYEVWGVGNVVGYAPTLMGRFGGRSWHSVLGSPPLRWLRPQEKLLGPPYSLQLDGLGLASTLAV